MRKPRSPLREFAEAAVAFWQDHLVVPKVEVRFLTTRKLEWQLRHGPYRGLVLSEEQRTSRCQKRGGKPWGHALGVACCRCKGILVAVGDRRRNRPQLWRTAAHEVLHLAHPRWSEGKIEGAAIRFCRQHDWREAMGREGKR